jgi:predicted TPR repeat methyltransferase
MNIDNSPNHWDEETSSRYLDYGRYFVPAREQQMRIMVDLLRGVPRPNLIFELCCGEGLLAELPGSSYCGLDGSAVMLEQAGFEDIYVHFLQAGHALFSGWKKPGKQNRE